MIVKSGSLAELLRREVGLTSERPTAVGLGLALIFITSPLPSFGSVAQWKNGTPTVRPSSPEHVTLIPPLRILAARPLRPKTRCRANAPSIQVRK